MNTDIKQLNEAIKVAEIFWDEYNNKDKSNNCWSVFTGLLQLTQTCPALEAEKIDECFFSTKELAEKLSELNQKQSNFYQGKEINRLYSEVTKRLDEVHSRLVEIAHDTGVAVIPSIEKTQTSGGKGNQSSYHFIARPIDDIELKKPDLSLNDENKQNSTVVSYHIESTPKLPIWSRWLNDIDMQRYRLPVLLLTISPVLALMISVILFWLSLSYDIPYNSSIIVGLLIYSSIFCLCFHYLFSLINFNIALLPDWMLPLRLKAATLRYELHEPNSEHISTIRKLCVRVYTGKCPICSHRIYLQAKGIPFNKRIIGVCSNNPIEHQFSFDYTTLKGEKLTC